MALRSRRGLVVEIEQGIDVGHQRRRLGGPDLQQHKPTRDQQLVTEFELLADVWMLGLAW